MRIYMAEKDVKLKDHLGEATHEPPGGWRKTTY